MKCRPTARLVCSLDIPAFTIAFIAFAATSSNCYTVVLTYSPGTLGISEYAAKALGDAVYIELPQVDIDVSEGDAIGAVESVKSASDILTPVTGTVVEVNSVLEQEAAKINKDPEGEFWIAKIAVSGEPEGRLMSKSEYTEFTEEA